MDLLLTSVILCTPIFIFSGIFLGLSVAFFLASRSVGGNFLSGAGTILSGLSGWAFVLGFLEAPGYFLMFFVKGSSWGTGLLLVMMSGLLPVCAVFPAVRFSKYMKKKFLPEKRSL